MSKHEADRKPEIRLKYHRDVIFPVKFIDYGENRGGTSPPAAGASQRGLGKFPAAGHPVF